MIRKICQLIVETVRAVRTREFRCARWCDRHGRGYASDLCPGCNGERLERLERTDTRRHRRSAGWPVNKWAERGDQAPDFDVEEVRRAVRASRRNGLHRLGE